ncbi:MAG: protein kinase [Acidobacteriota bacterium]|nr:protein kinase [Acidobacteriota bacterium]
MNCPNCSGENSDTRKFCGECGTPLPESSLSGEAGETLSETQILPWAVLRTGDIFASRYQVIEQLGAGGMGRVYRVLDKKLDEEIALKLIKAEAAGDRKTLDRFRAELKTARQVVHQNVARVFDLNETDGMPFITMEYVRGENLRALIKKVGRLDASQAVPIAAQVCRGLAEAHRRGIIHRDLKPQNIMIDEDGKAQIMDFGLARLARSVELSEKGPAEGTPAYIAPEQIENRTVDHRADLYSLGIVLYEMVTGHPPFRTSSAAGLVHKHLTQSPRNPREVNPDIPSELARIIMKCLKKQPEKRYQNAAEILVDLDRLEKDNRPHEKKTSSPSYRARVLRLAAGIAGLTAIAFLAIHNIPLKPTPHKIAVLLDLRRDVDQADASHFRGLQENIINKLIAGIPRLDFVPWKTMSDYGNPRHSDMQIGEDLSAKYLLRLYPSAGEADYRLTAHLIDASKSEIVQSFNLGPKDNYFQLEDELPEQLARALKITFIEERLRNVKLDREPKNLEAYNHYLDGMEISRDDFDEAVGHFEKAIEIDPRYALAYWALGNVYEARYNRPGHHRNKEDLDSMFWAYRKAGDIGPHLPEPHLGLGWASFYDGDNNKAFQYFQRALKLDPKNVMVNQDAGAFLRSLGLYDQAVKYLDRAARLDPVNPEPVIQMAQCRAYMGRYEKALKLTQRAFIINPVDLQVLNAFAINLVMMGRLEEAENQLQNYEKFHPENRRPYLPSALLAATRGQKEKALELISGSQENPVPENILARRWLLPESTCLYLLLGMRDEALQNIEFGIEKGFQERLMYLYSYPSLSRNARFNTLRKDPRFQNILKKQKEYYLKELKKFEKL